MFTFVLWLGCLIACQAGLLWMSSAAPEIVHGFTAFLFTYSLVELLMVQFVMGRLVYILNKYIKFNFVADRFAEIAMQLACWAVVLPIDYLIDFKHLRFAPFWASVLTLLTVIVSSLLLAMALTGELFAKYHRGRYPSQQKETD